MVVSCYLYIGSISTTVDTTADIKTLLTHTIVNA